MPFGPIRTGSTQHRTLPPQMLPSCWSSVASYLPCTPWLFPESDAQQPILQPPVQTLEECLIPPAPVGLYGSADTRRNGFSTGKDRPHCPKHAVSATGMRCCAKWYHCRLSLHSGKRCAQISVSISRFCLIRFHDITLLALGAADAEPWDSQSAWDAPRQQAGASSTRGWSNRGAELDEVSVREVMPYLEALQELTACAPYGLSHTPAPRSPGSAGKWVCASNPFRTLKAHFETCCSGECC